MERKFRIILFAIIALLIPVRASAKVIPLEKGAAYKIRGTAQYHSTKSSVIRVYPSGICFAAAKGKAKVKGGGKTFSFAVRRQTGYSITRTCSFTNKKTVTLTAAKGYRVYYTTGKKYAKSRVLTSGKTMKFTFTKTTNLHIYAVKKKISKARLNKLLKKKADNLFVYTKYRIPVYKTPEGLKSKYGKSLSSVKLPSGFTWENSGTVGNVGTNFFKAKFTPADTMKFKTITGISVPVTVTKAKPSYSLPSCFYAVFGQDIESIELPKRFTWESSGTITQDPVQTYYATYTPKDTDNYKIVKNIPVTVMAGEKLLAGHSIDPIPDFTYTGNPMCPVVTVPTLTEGIDYKVTYSNNVLPGKVSVTVTGTGSYVGELQAGFTIRPTLSGYIASLKDMAKKLKTKGFSYGNSSVKGSYASALSSNKKFNCAVYVSWTLQQMGILPEGKTFWCSIDGGHASGFTYMNNHPERYTIIKTKSLDINNKKGKNKSMKELLKAGVLKKGDICGFYIEGRAPHTAVYAGNTSAGNAKWYSGGSGDFKKMFDGSGNVVPRRYKYYENANDYLTVIIRIKY